MDVPAILNRLHIDYRERGPNVRKNCVALHCPWCGEEDPSTHLNVNIKTGYCSCWRNHSHQGPLRKLLTVLVGATAAGEAADHQQPPPESFEAAAATLQQEPALCKKAQTIEWPAEAREIGNRGGTSHAWKYLESRGFPAIEIPNLVKTYNLRTAYFGPWNHRLLFPIYNWDEKLIAWTGRAIGPSSLRYKAHPAGSAIKNSVFNLPRAKEGGDKLFIVEGPMDALRTDYYLKRSHAVSLMSTAAIPQQVDIINSLSNRYRRIVIMLDSDAMAQALFLQTLLSFLGPTVHYLPDGVKDPAELTRTQIEALE